jgi:hypothetical protein
MHFLQIPKASQNNHYPQQNNARNAMHQTNPFPHPILSNPTSSPRSQQPTHAAHHRRESPNRLTIPQEENESKQRIARENAMMEIQTAIMLDDVKRKSARDNDFLVARIRTLEAES